MAQDHEERKEGEPIEELSLVEAKGQLGKLGDRAFHRGERFIVKRGRDRLFAIVPLDDLQIPA